MSEQIMTDEEWNIGVARARFAELVRLQAEVARWKSIADERGEQLVALTEEVNRHKQDGYRLSAEVAQIKQYLGDTVTRLQHYRRRCGCLSMAGVCAVCVQTLQVETAAFAAFINSTDKETP